MQTTHIFFTFVTLDTIWYANNELVIALKISLQLQTLEIF